MKLIYILSLLILFIQAESYGQCSVVIAPSSPVSICSGDSVLLTATVSGLNAVLDQKDSIYSAGTSARNLPGYSMAQWFTAGKTGMLTMIKMGVFNYINGAGVFNVYDGAGIAGTLLYTSNVNMYCASGSCLDSFPVSVAVQAGNSYTFQFIPGTGIPDPYGVQADASSSYVGGSMYIIDPSGVYPLFDMIFETYVQGTAYYSWSDGSTGSSIYASAPNYYNILITDSAGCIATDSVLVNIAPSPIIDLGNDTTICGTCSITLDAGSGLNTYLWSTGFVSQTITINTTGIYSVLVTNNYGCTGSDTIVVTKSTVGLAELNSDPVINYSYSDEIIRFQINSKNNSPVTVELTDENGKNMIANKQVINKREIEIPLTNFAEGMYILRVLTDNGSFIKKIIR